MHHEAAGKSGSHRSRWERYSVGYGLEAHTWHSRRKAADRASFFLPHLRPGMRLLDCGCGPGTITTGLAEAIQPGEVVAIDLKPLQIQRARALARGTQTSNLHYCVADVYELPFPDGYFDGAFAHNVVEHLSDPLRAFREIHRVLKPGGLIGVRDPDYGTGIWEPSSRLLRATSALLLRIREYNGGSPYYARHQRALLKHAGFDHVEGFAFAEYQGKREETSAFAHLVAEVLRDQATVEVALTQGWADEETLGSMAAEVRMWGERGDAFRALVDCAALAQATGQLG